MTRTTTHIVGVQRKGDRLAALAFLAPTIMVVIVFVVWPLASTVRYAVSDVDGLGRVGRFVGSAHVEHVLGSDDFRSSLAATLRFVALTMPIGLVFGLLLALAAHRPLRGIAVFRVIFSSTMATSAALSSALFITLFAPSTGAARYALQAIGVLGSDDRIDLLNDHRWAIVAVAGVTVWSNLGFGFILFSAALWSVPEVLYESAALDGAGRFNTFRHITFPLIRPIVGVVAITSTASGVLTFGEIDFLTKGGPGGRTNVLAYALYTEAFRDRDLSSAAILALSLIVVSLILGASQFRLLHSRRDDITA